MRLIFVFTLGVFFSVSTAFGQNQQVSSYIKTLYNIWDSTYHNYDIKHVAGDSLAGVNLINKVPIQTDNTNKNSWNASQLEQQVLMEEAAVLKGDIGLGVSAAYAYNLDPGIGFEDNLFYTQKFRTSIGMDLMKSGYFSNHAKSKIKTNELEISRLKYPDSKKQLDRYLKWHNIIYQFNLKKIEILRKRDVLATHRVDMASKLNSLKYVSQKDLIKTISSHAEIKSMLAIYQGYNDQLSSELNVKDQSFIEYPLLDIDYTYSYKLMTFSEPDSTTALMLENIKLEDKAIHDFRLRPFVAFNWFDLVSTNPGYRNYFSVGVTLAAPLNFNSKNRSNLREAKSNLAMTPSVGSPEIQQDVLTQFYEFRYKLKQFTVLYHNRIMYEELLRKERVKHSISPLSFNPIDALSLLDNLMKIDIELIDLKQQMYLKLLNIHTDLPYSQASKLFKPITLERKEKTRYNHKNSIYIWSSSILKYDPIVIAHYLELNLFNSATLSLNTNPKARVRTFKLIDILHDQQISVELMIGKNSLINGGFNAYIQKLGTGVDWTKISALHLDVEPHVRDDWHENKAAYLTKYHALLKDARAFCDANNIKLGVSIPTHYPEADIRKIFDIVDRVYFMCYENVKTDFIVRKTEIYPKDKTYIALRTNDFKDRLAIESKFKELNERMTVAGFVVHDFDSLLEFDKKSIK